MIYKDRFLAYIILNFLTLGVFVIAYTIPIWVLIIVFIEHLFIILNVPSQDDILEEDRKRRR